MCKNVYNLDIKQYLFREGVLQEVWKIPSRGEGTQMQRVKLLLLQERPPNEDKEKLNEHREQLHVYEAKGILS